MTLQVGLLIYYYQVDGRIRIGPWYYYQYWFLETGLSSGRNLWQ